MPKVMEPVFDKPNWDEPTVEIAMKPTVDEEEAMFVGDEPRPTGPTILSAEDSLRLWERVRSREPVVLTERTREAIANYKRIMSEVVD